MFVQGFHYLGEGRGLRDIQELGSENNCGLIGSNKGVEGFEIEVQGLWHYYHVFICSGYNSSAGSIELRELFSGFVPNEAFSIVMVYTL
ncbi:hypothetical protein NPIL_192701 [Nephila pilipes]|uniref:Uncharacterized protein n=1 Tax=Nephila pilipes TaxID=299642 RepID=A0A8X6QER0_NEPPI|nr:hypothetical protein NPIL_192701 [Nephila pilipes]